MNGVSPMVKRKRIPLRTCVSCGLKTAKRELLRIVLSPEGQVAVDQGGKLNGRGAYVCEECRAIPGSLRRGRLEHSLKTRLGENEWDRLLNEVVIASVAETVD